MDSCSSRIVGVNDTNIIGVEFVDTERDNADVESVDIEEGNFNNSNDTIIDEMGFYEDNLMTVRTKRTEKDKTTESAEEFLLTRKGIIRSFKTPLLPQWFVKNETRIKMEGNIFIHLKLMT